MGRGAFYNYICIDLKQVEQKLKLSSQKLKLPKLKNKAKICRIVDTD